MRREYCTLFDRNYCAKGLALYESLQRHSSEDFMLHVLTMDEATHAILYEMALPNVRLIALSAFEKELHLAGTREGRSWAEWCWTCASQLMEYLLPRTEDGAMYVDSDSLFFSDPKVIFDEIGNRSIGITPHRFSEAEQVRLGKNGDFNVGIVIARNTEIGRACISRWAAQCRERCSSNVGCGDQRYLDEFIPTFGEEVCAIQNLGVNLGPWSLDHLTISKRMGIVYVEDDPLVAYHAHEFIDHKYLTGYPLTQQALDYIYCPYVTAIEDAKDSIRAAEMRITGHTKEAERQWETA